MAQENVYAIPNVPAPNTPVVINEEICTGCNSCVNVCQVDVFLPNPEQGKPPVIMHPDECWYGGCCVLDCPVPGAISFNWALQQRGFWKDKDTGERFRFGTRLE